MAKDKKAKTADKKARVAQKQNKKAAQKEKKAKTKGDRADDSDADDVDLDEVLAAYAQQQAQFLKVTEALCEAPPPRSSATLIGSPSNSNELFLFGGEYYNGSLATFNNDLYVYLIDRDEWRLITSPNSPLPRSGHAWCRGGNAGGIYLFGGEFSSPKQGTFYHYNDFWRLDPSTREWTRLESKGKGPPARSGHRMTYYKNYILLFGGFQDTSQQTKYLQDLWIYDCQKFVWHNPSLPPATQKPDARSSFSFLPHVSGAVTFGGYSRVKGIATAGKQTKGGSQGSRTIVKPVIHQDTWFLRVTQPATEAAANAAPHVRWERRKRPANSPNPSRVGATMVFHQGRGILFGGVHDVEESEEGIDSEFFDTLYAWNVERNRFFQMTLRRPRLQNKRQQNVDRVGNRRGRGKADEEELLRNLAALETGESITDAASMQMDLDNGPQEKVAITAAKEVKMEMPHRRFNSQLTVQNDNLYIYGGTYENGDREYTFDDMWAIDLGKLDGVKEIFHRELDDWHGSDEEESDYEEDGGSDDDSEDDAMAVDKDVDEVHDDDQTAATNKESNRPPGRSALIEEVPDLDEEPEDVPIEDRRPYPRSFESLKDFFVRTSIEWQEIVLDDVRRIGIGQDSKSVKELRKGAFALAEQRWWDCREEVTALEDEQEEAGIGEVVSLADRGAASSGGTVRRR
ncbi:MAG: hypothetical protein M1833_006819 [Piccolia ochrophora]|nr:MAG: hypothetical protein M1833_006819 [Piccolia ochrophora]